MLSPKPIMRKAYEEVCGSPALPIKQFFRQVATLARLSRGTGTRAREE